MYSECSKKISFDTEKQAKNAATVAKHQHGSRLKVYKCTKCQLWHLSTDYGDQDDN